MLAWLEIEMEIFDVAPKKRPRKARKSADGGGGVYVFQFIGKTAGDVEWFKVGWHGSSNPWWRARGAAFESVALPDETMKGHMYPENYRLCAWWRGISMSEELNMHRHFDSVRKGEWYTRSLLSEALSYLENLTGRKLEMDLDGISPTFVALPEMSGEIVKRIRKDNGKSGKTKENGWSRPISEELADVDSYFTRTTELLWPYGNIAVIVDTTSFKVLHIGALTWTGALVGFWLRENGFIATTLLPPQLVEVLHHAKGLARDSPDEQVDAYKEAVVRCLASVEPVLRQGFMFAPLEPFTVAGPPEETSIVTIHFRQCVKKKGDLQRIFKADESLKTHFWQSRGMFAALEDSFETLLAVREQIESQLE